MIGSQRLPRWSRVSVFTVLLALVAGGCGPHHYWVRVTVPPRVDVSQYGRVGLVNFTIENAKGELNVLATRKFSEAILDAQRVEVMELGAPDSLLRRIGETQVSPASVQALGSSRDVPAIFAGHIKVSNVKPSGQVLGLNLPRLEADVTVELTVGLFSTKSGGTLWRASGALSERVGQLGLVGGEPYFSAKDPNVAYGQLIDRLVARVTADLRPTYTSEERIRR
jgi:hypothetical protein